MSNLIAQLEDWERIEQSLAAKKIGTPEADAHLVAAKRYRLVRESLHRTDAIEGAFRSALMTMSIAAGILDKDGDEHGVAWNLRYEIAQGKVALGIDDAATPAVVPAHELRNTVIDLLEILRQWEPKNASENSRQRIIQAMYQVGILKPLPVNLGMPTITDDLH